MRKALVLAFILCLSLGLVSFGCSGKKAASVSEAIQASKAMQTVQQKADYLIGQAKAFYSSKDFQQTVDIAQYVLAYVDNKSQDARSLIDKAKSELTALAQKKAEELKGKISGFAK